MNFFQHQDKARKKTGLLITLLVSAIFCLIAITVFAIGLFLYFIQSNSTSIGAINAQNTPLTEHFWLLLNSQFTLWVAIAVVSVVLLGSAFKLLQLGRGGRAVAESLGGKPLSAASNDPLERRVLNVVEEMAIASGNPVPSVYLIEDSSINAFAAGFDRRDAVIGVTRGCVKLLTRDELQGVIAHEFSHIHNGDMRLNMRLIAILHGILLIGLIGYYIVYSSGGSRYGFRRSNRQGGKQISLGLALMAIGYGGTFFGNIIKSAVSRQREYLADASAVQFTRNPLGISGALKKIGGFSHGSILSEGSAAEFSHMFFGEGIKQSFLSLMATHPPLNDRIKRIEPSWKGKFAKVSDMPVTDGTSTSSDDGIAHFNSSAESTTDIIEIIGEPNQTHLLYAKELIGGLPVELVNATHQPFSARAVVYGLLLDQNSSICSNQLKQLKNAAHPASFSELSKISDSIRNLNKSHRLPLLNMCIPALKQLSQPQYHVFKKNLALLIRADKKVTLFEWCLYRITIKSIETNTISKSHSLINLSNEAIYLLWATCLIGNNKNHISAFKKGLKALGFGEKIDSPNTELSLPMLDNALNKLENLKPLEKPRLLKALIDVINADKIITEEENEIFRAIADTLNCPVPPLLSAN